MRLLWPVAVLALIAACGEGESRSRTDDGCAITLTGARDEAWTYPQTIETFTTDYWFSDAYLEAVADTSEESFDAQMAQSAQIVTLLRIACVDSGTITSQGTYLAGRDGVNVAATSGTTRADIPAGPGSYAVAEGRLKLNGAAGTMFTEVVFEGDGRYETVPESGSLEIETWTSDHIEGSVTFDAVLRGDPAQMLHVEVTFAFGCQPWFDNC